MTVLISRIRRGSVSIEGKVVSSIDAGIAVFVGIEKGDDDSIAAAMAKQIVNLRIFENEQGKMDYSVGDKKYQILCIPNFTLAGNINKGRRPSFEKAMAKEQARKLFEDFVLVLESKGVNVKCGSFGAHMDIDLEMSGPVNFVLSGTRDSVLDSRRTPSKH